VWDAAFETLASLGPPADEEHAIDSTIVRAHQHAAGVPLHDVSVQHLLQSLRSPGDGRASGRGHARDNLYA
jgi:hypothetical protein